MYKYVYVLTSSKGDRYYNQLLISILSLLEYCSKPNIVVLVDENTFNGLNGERAEIFNYAKIIKVNVPSQYSKGEKSRYIKTSARRYIQGDYLFVDTDSLFCQDISLFIDSSAQIAFVEDLNLTLIERNPTDLKVLKKTFSLLEYDFSVEEPYYNSGIYWVKDTKETRAFFEEWHQEWKKCCEKGIALDQPSLNFVNNRKGGVIVQLNPRLNVQVTGTTGAFKYLLNPGIIHYFNGNETFVSLTDGAILDKVQTDRSYIENIIKNPSECFRIGVFIPSDSKKFRFMNTESYKILLQIFLNFKKFYSFIEFISGKIMTIGRKICGKEKMKIS